MSNLNNLKKLVTEVNDYLEVTKTKVEYNIYCNYISVNRGEDDEYFFQGEECENLIKEYENDCLYPYFILEHYINFVSREW